jgi:hypothetical protein
MSQTKIIEKLNPEQEKAIPVYIEKWVKMAERPMEKERAFNAVTNIYKAMGEKKPLVVVGDSPISTAIMCAMFWCIFKGKKSQLYSQLHSQLGSQLESQLSSQLYSQLSIQLYSQLHSQLHSQLRSQLHSQLCSQLQSLNGQWYLSVWWLAWCGWCDYARHIGVKFDEDAYRFFMDFNSEINFIIPFKGIAFISEKPSSIKWKNRLLHCEDGLAVSYKDGYGLWCLNGVCVTKEIVLTPHDKLDPKLILKEKNAEVRREIVRKIGIERVCKGLKAKVVDSVGEYELLMLDLGDGRVRPYLKMKNPSVGTYHIEGVHPDCDTVKKALNWRNQTEETPVSLT